MTKEELRTALEAAAGQTVFIQSCLLHKCGLTNYPNDSGVIGVSSSETLKQLNRSPAKTHATPPAPRPKTETKP